jgi:signal transduction histidine kinase
LISREPGCLAKISNLSKKIVFNIQRVDKMIIELLDASRVRAGEHLVLRVSECSLSQIVHEAIDDLVILYGPRFEIKEEGPNKGFWDQEALKRVVENLCNNAVKYGDKSSPITVTLFQNYGRTILSVHNFGNPIPPEERAVLFRPLWRSKSAEVSPMKGWGLGLILVRGVVETHGGSVIVESSVEKGTTFKVNIPNDARLYQKKTKFPFVA